MIKRKHTQTQSLGSDHATVPSQTGSSCHKGRATSSSPVAQNKKTLAPNIETLEE